MAEVENQIRADDPLPWLLTLEMSRQCGDFEKAAAAKKELERLGVRVRYGRRPKPEKGASHAAR